MKRTKESLIAQQQLLREKEGKKGPSVQFSFTQFPSGRSLRMALTFLLLAVACFVVPAILPDFGKPLYHSRMVANVGNFELTNEVFKGQFSRTAHIGDTRGDRVATFQAVSTLTANAGRIQNEDLTRNYVNQLEAQDFNKNTEEIYQGIVQLKGLGLLKEDSVSAKYAKKYFQLLMQLTERHSAFRLNNLRSASVGATYYAFKATEELDKMKELQAREEFDSAIQFVLSMKDAASGGFRDTAGVNATILATFHAVQVLARAPTQSEEILKALAGVDDFVFSCQAKDGGFANEPITNSSTLFHSHSNMATTSQAVYVIESLKRLGVVSYPAVDPKFYAYYDANSYLRACLSLRYGVLASFPSNEPDLEASYYFAQLAKDFPGLSYGTPRTLQLAVAGLGLLFLVAAGFYFYRQQMAKGSSGGAVSEIKWALAYLGAGAVASVVFPPAAVIVYLLFAMRLAIVFYEVGSSDTTDGLMTLVAAANSSCFLALVFAFNYITPLVFANARVFYMLVLWGTVVTFLVSVIACYLTGIKKVFFYVNAASLAWIVNVVVFYAYLYGRSETQFAFRLLAVHGHYFVVLVLLPALFLALNDASSAVGSALYLRGGFVGGRSGSKPSSKKK